MRQHNCFSPQRLVLATDLDGTLVGDPDALGLLNSWIATRRDQVTLVYLTGRHHASALELIYTTGLLAPDILVTDVGAEIRRAPANPLDPASSSDQEWHELVQEDWQPALIRPHLTGIPGLAAQSLPVCTRLGYQTTGVPDRTAGIVRNVLAVNNLRAQVVVSCGGMLDVLPPKAGKGPALRYLQQKMCWDPGSLLVCGDSGNDLDMLTLGFPAVVVGNAAPELIAEHLPPTVYRADQPYAAGIIEALRFYHLDDTVKPA